MTDTSPIRQTKFAAFEGASHDDERMCAILVAKDANTGALKAHVTTPDHRQPPSPDAIDMLVNAVEIANI